MNKSLAVLTVIGALIIFILGGGAGIYYQVQQDKLNASNVSPSFESPTAQQLVRKLSSKAVPAITAYGQVTNISGRNITINNAGESLVIKITDNAQFFYYDQSAAYKPGAVTVSASGQKPAAFSDVKVGSNVSVNLRILSNNTLEGFLVVVIK